MINKELLLMTLRRKVDRFNSSYYTKTPIVSDATYDRLLKWERDLHRQLKIKYNERVGHVLSKYQKTYFHITPFLSIKKVYTLIDLGKFIKKYSQSPLSIEPKWDGIAISLRFDTPEPYGISRGDGIKGHLLSKVLLNFILKYIKHSHKGVKEIRGELIMHLKVYRAYYSSDYSSARHVVASLLTKKDISCIKGLAFIPYEVMYEESYGKNDGRYNCLTQLGVSLYQNTSFVLNAYNKHHLSYIYNFFNKKYPIDGLVVKIDNLSLYKLEGSTRHHPRGMIALKFYPERWPSRINSISWQISRTGAYTPVACIRPTVIEGSVISRITLHNINNIKKLKLQVGSIIQIYKAGGIIPTIEAVYPPKITYYLRGINTPSACIFCSTKLAKNLVCTNFQCPEIVVQQCIYAYSRTIFNILSLSDSSIRAYKYPISNIYDIFIFNKQAHYSVFGNKSIRAQNIIFSIERARCQPLFKHVLAWSIPTLNTAFYNKYLSKATLPKDILKICRILESSTAISITKVVKYIMQPPIIRLIMKGHYLVRLGILRLTSTAI